MTAVVQVVYSRCCKTGDDCVRLEIGNLWQRTKDNGWVQCLIECVIKQNLTVFYVIKYISF